MKKNILISLLFFIAFNSNLTAQNYALQFDGNNDFFLVGHYDSLDLDTNNFTLEAWINVGTKSYSSYQTIITNRDSVRNGFWFGLNNNGLLTCILNNDYYVQPTIAMPYIYSYDLRDDGCHHVAVVKTAGFLTFYVDGTSLGNDTLTTHYDVSTFYPVTCGADTTSDSTFALKGEIDDIRIWNAARIGSDIANNYVCCVDSASRDLFANWTLDQPQWSVIFDRTANGFNGEFFITTGAPHIDPQWVNSTCIAGECVRCIYYVPALADPLCTQDVNTYGCGAPNLVCNGDFEQGVAANLIPQGAAFWGCTPFGSSAVTNWCVNGSNLNTPDLFARGAGTLMDIPNNWAALYLPNTCGLVDTWNGTPNDRYAGLGESMISGSAYTESMVTGLTNPLIYTRSYTLKLKAYVLQGYYDNGGITTDLNYGKLTFALSNGTGGYQSLGVQTVLHDDCNWQDVYINFTRTGLPSLYNLIIGTESYNLPGENVYIYIDDVSLYENTTFPSNWPQVDDHTGDGSGRPQDITTDPAGNVYITGAIHEAFSFDIANPQVLAGNGFVASYDNCGNYRWQTEITGKTTGYSIVYDAIKDVVDVGGADIGSNTPFVMQFDAKTGSCNSAFTNPVFNGTEVTKLVIDKSNPTEIFVLNDDGTNTWIDKINANNLTAASGTYIQRYFGGFLYSDMDQLPASESYNLVLCGVSIREEAPDLSGVVNNNTSLSGYFYFTKIAASPGGYVYLTGNYYTSATFNGTTITQTSTAGINAFVLQYDYSNVTIPVLKWTGQIDSDYESAGWDITTDNQDNCYIAGKGTGYTDVYDGPISGTPVSYFTLDNVTYDNTFHTTNYPIAVKYDVTGTPEWAKAAYDSNIGGEGMGVAYNGADCFFLGYFQGYIDIGATTLLNTGCDNVFTTRIADYGTSAVFERHPKTNSNTNKPLVEDKLSVIPNPANDLITVSINDKLTKDAKTEMIDIMGNSILTGYALNEPVNIAKFTNGIYLIKVTSNNKQYTSKFIVRH